MTRTKLTTRERILNAAERLLTMGSAAFSMRDLASEAGLSFATPFNQFGSKAAIMQALSARRIAQMRTRVAKAALPDKAVTRVLGTLDIAVSVMLAAPDVNRIVMAAIGSPSESPGDVLSDSCALWREALGSGKGLASASRSTALSALPLQLAISFRGVLSFWTAGEISNAALSPQARASFAASLLGFTAPNERIELLRHFHP